MKQVRKWALKVGQTKVNMTNINIILVEVIIKIQGIGLVIKTIVSSTEARYSSCGLYYKHAKIVATVACYINVL